MFTSFASIPSTRLVGSRTTLFICLLIAATRSVNGCNICESTQNFLTNPDDTLTDIPEEFNLGSEATCSTIYEAGLKDYSGDCTDLRDFIYGKCRCNGIFYAQQDDGAQPQQDNGPQPVTDTSLGDDKKDDAADDKKDDAAAPGDKKENVTVTDDKKVDEAAKDDKKDDEAAKDDKKDDEAVTDDKKEGTNETYANTTSMTTINSSSRTTNSTGITAIVLSTIFSLLLGLLM